MKINKNNLSLKQDEWKYFNLIDLFPRYERGNRLIKEDRKYGNIPFITAGHENEGFAEYIGNSNIKTYKNVITIDMFGNAFYRPYTFACDDNIIVLLDSNKINVSKALFICSVINMDSYRYVYGRQYRQKDFRIHKIKLPVNKIGMINYDFMKNYIGKVLPPKSNISEKKLKLEINDWKSYRIGDIFKIRRGNRIVKNIDYTIEKNITNIYPVVTATTKNNSVDGYYSKYNSDGNILVCGGEATGMFTTYQSNKLWVMDRSRILKPKENVPLNKYNGLFLCPILSFNQYKFTYGKSANPKTIGNILIKLPTTKQNKPDWNYMENYIKSLPYSDLI